ncbi:hypothetical protein H6F43_21740 [Leptolyngbya sp. FACHB-36]|uniref:hypothetical protein n=1 Tax=Leptolyngbya sp. FACHB-36 TaxID=2692808 RepID=UPI0016819E6C|nr:hypothetical protein [Leptolyngbya sp. FACHB-36]MBD2022810.1 hypothetical protein [Leptolyngbya sp. FACHB-36]
MNRNELASQARAAIEQTLDQLQTATLLIAQLETQVAAAGRSVQALSNLIETYVTQQDE